MNRITSFLILCCSFCISASAQSFLPEWKEGYLDIHTIATGKGDCTYIIMPDGTTMMIDAGDMTNSSWKNPILPDSTKRVAEWIADYVGGVSTGLPHPDTIDYFMLTHFHVDHMGHPGNMKEGMHGYKLAGITEVGELLHFNKIVDRAYPDYDFPSNEHIKKSAGKCFDEYRAFIEYQTSENGSTAEKFKVGSHRQFHLCNNAIRFADKFDIWNIAGSCMINSKGRKAKPLYTKDEYPLLFDENMFSCALLIKYGNFYYYNGGDIPGSNYGPAKEVAHNRDYESAIADAIGHPVQAIKADHHGWKDSCNPYFMWKMQPDAIIFPACHERHPWSETLKRVSDPQLPGKRMLFATSESGKALIGEEMFNLITAVGHIVIRVYEEGRSWQIFVLNASNTAHEIIWSSGIMLL